MQTQARNHSDHPSTPSDADAVEFGEQSPPLAVAIRPCRQRDLLAMEWFGLFAADRALIRSAFNDHVHGRALMLVAEVGDAVVGQVWLDFSRQYLDNIGTIWALCVSPSFQRSGIGTRMILVAEDILRGRGFDLAEMCVEQTNRDAWRLYERLGYRRVETVITSEGAVTLGYVRVCVPATQYLLRKRLFTL